MLSKGRGRPSLQTSPVGLKNPLNKSQPWEFLPVFAKSSSSCSITCGAQPQSQWCPAGALLAQLEQGRASPGTPSSASQQDKPWGSVSPEQGAMGESSVLISVLEERELILQGDTGCLPPRAQLLVVGIAPELPHPREHLHLVLQHRTGRPWEKPQIAGFRRVKPGLACRAQSAEFPVAQ